jgi:hypothetical protein
MNMLQTENSEELVKGLRIHFERLLLSQVPSHIVGDPGIRHSRVSNTSIDGYLLEANDF